MPTTLVIVALAIIMAANINGGSAIDSMDPQERDIDMETNLRSPEKREAGKHDGCLSDEWLGFNNECYHLAHERRVKYSNAVLECSELGATLAIIHNEDEQEFLAGAMHNDHTGYFIGLTKQTDGDFVWDDGTRLTYASWTRHRYIYYDGAKECVIMWADDGGLWKDNYCGSTRAYICQKPKAKCTAETAPMNGTRTPDMATIAVGATLTFSCHAAYNLAGTPSGTCTDPVDGTTPTFKPDLSDTTCKARYWVDECLNHRASFIIKYPPETNLYVSPPMDYIPFEVKHSDANVNIWLSPSTSDDDVERKYWIIIGRGSGHESALVIENKKAPPDITLVTTSHILGEPNTWKSFWISFDHTTGKLQVGEGGRPPFMSMTDANPVNVRYLRFAVLQGVGRFRLCRDKLSQ